MSMSDTAHLVRECHVRNCYVWSEIHYLDSTTDYREYLSRPVARERKTTSDEFVMLDSSRHASSKRTFLAFGVVITCLVALWLLSYGLLDL